MAVNKIIGKNGAALTMDEFSMDYDSIMMGFPRVYAAKAIAEAYRPFKGKAHVTDIIGCMRSSLLKEKTPFDIDLDKMMPLFVGNSLHSAFSDAEFANIKLENDLMVGEADYIERCNESWIIWDFKFVKSYAARLAIGMVSQDVPIIGPHGLPEVYKSGAKAGKPKTRKEWSQDQRKADTKKYADQLNCYRFMMEDNGEIVNNLYIFMGIKDGGQTAAGNGITSNSVMFRVPNYDLSIYKPKMMERAERLVAAMMSDKMVDPGEPTAEEVWDGRLCNDFCPVASQCDKIFGCKYLKEEGL